MTKYKVTYRTREDDPKDESVIVSYEVDANSLEEAKRKAGTKFEAEYPKMEPGEYDIDTQWGGS